MLYFQLQDGKRVMDCLKKCVRITKQCMEVSVQVQLFVELLNYYVYFYERGNNNVCVSQTFYIYFTFFNNV